MLCVTRFSALSKLLMRRLCWTCLFRINRIDLWKAWKKRVANHITHEEDILCTDPPSRTNWKPTMANAGKHWDERTNRTGPRSVSATTTYGSRSAISTVSGKIYVVYTWSYANGVPMAYTNVRNTSRASRRGISLITRRVMLRRVFFELCITLSHVC